MFGNGFYPRDLLFLLAGLIAGGYFFVVYPSEHPQSALDATLSPDSVEVYVQSILSGLGYVDQPGPLTPVAGSKRRLLDSLQAELGRREAVALLNRENPENLYPFFWSVAFDLLPAEESETSRQGPPVNDDNNFEIRLSSTGRLLEFINSRERLPDRLVNRDALKHLFHASPDSPGPLWPSFSDSLLGRLLYFDLEQQNRLPASQVREAGQVEKDLSRGIPYRHSLGDARELAAYHLAETGWNAGRLEPDTVSIRRIGSVNAAEVRLKSSELIHGQQLFVTALITPTGALLSLGTEYNVQQSGDRPELWEFGKVLMVFLFAVACIIIFFFRIRARVVDTKAALIIGLVGGVMVSAAVLFRDFNQFNVFDASTGWFERIVFGMEVGVAGALSSIGFFVVSAIGDSITRQHWRNKLAHYDFLRQGMVFNKPMGSTLIRSVVLSFILAGFWTLLMRLFPDIYIGISQPFISDRVVWSPAYLFAEKGASSLMLLLAVFLVLGGQFYAQTRNRYITGGAMVLALGIISPVPLTMGPEALRILVLLFFGLVMVLIYFQWDFLTLFISHVLFGCLIATAGGWMIENSPDLYLFFSFIAVVSLLLAVGFVAVYKGKDEEALPNYVPEYVEELAQEQRIRQELQIARRVQESFLPVKTPQLKNLELAAVCKPAFETGGDYYDFIELDDHRVAMAVGDVSGKGIQAAFYMTFIKGILHSLCREVDSPSELLKKANKLFYDNARRGTFVSLIYGIIDLKERTFCFARAGHNPIIYVQRDAETDELQPQGLGLGLTKTEKFDTTIEEQVLNLNKDDVLILYTDGFIEALNSTHQFYGSKRLMSIINEQKEKTAKEILNVISDDITRFIGQTRQHDDMTMLVIKMK